MKMAIVRVMRMMMVMMIMMVIIIMMMMMMRTPRELAPADQDMSNGNGDSTPPAKVGRRGRTGEGGVTFVFSQKRKRTPKVKCS